MKNAEKVLEEARDLDAQVRAFLENVDYDALIALDEDGGTTAWFAQLKNRPHLRGNITLPQFMAHLNAAIQEAIRRSGDTRAQQPPQEQLPLITDEGSGFRARLSG